jgi:hypothetical protein
MDVPALLVELTQVQVVVTAAEATCATTVLAAETFAWEAATVHDSVTHHVKDTEDRASIVEREALERVSRAEAENTTALASAREDAEGLAQKVALLQDELVAEHSLRSSSFCRPGVLSCVMPLSVLHG